MKKLWLMMSLMVVGLSACYIEPIRVHDDGHHRDRDYREGRDRHSDRDDHHQDRGHRDRSR